jgi:hypothetical protein
MMSAKWTKSTSTENSIRKLINGGVLPDAAIGGWRSSIGESFLDPRPGELVVFEDLLAWVWDSLSPILMQTS